MAMAFGKVTESAATALGSMRALKTEMAEIAASSQAVGVLALRLGSDQEELVGRRRRWRAFHRPG